MRFLGSNSPRMHCDRGSAPDPAGGAKALPRLPSRFQGAASRQRKGRKWKEGGGREGKGEEGIGKGKREGREGKREGSWERGRRREREGRGVCVIGVGRIDAPVL